MVKVPNVLQFAMINSCSSPFWKTFPQLCPRWSWSGRRLLRTPVPALGHFSLAGLSLWGEGAEEGNNKKIKWVTLCSRMQNISKTATKKYTRFHFMEILKDVKIHWKNINIICSCLKSNYCEWGRGRLELTYLDITLRENTNSSMMFPFIPVLIHLSNDVDNVSFLKWQLPTNVPERWVTSMKWKHNFTVWKCICLEHPVGGIYSHFNKG